MNGLNFRVFAKNKSANDFFGNGLETEMEYDEECCIRCSDPPIWTIEGQRPFDEKYLPIDHTYRYAWASFLEEYDEEGKCYEDITEIEAQFNDFINYLFEKKGFRIDKPEFNFFEKFTDFDHFLREKDLIFYEDISYEERLGMINDMEIAEILNIYKNIFDVDDFSFAKKSKESELIYIFDEEYCVCIGCFETTSEEEIKEVIADITQNKKIEREEGKKMKKMNLFKEEVGKIKDGMVALTMSGDIAVKREDGDYVRYDAKKQEMQNQMEFVLDIGTDFLMLVPVQTVEVGDIIKANGAYSQVISITKGGKMSAISFNSGTEKTFVKETNIMGMSFYFKVMNLLGGDMFGGSPTDNNPMGAMLPFLLMGKDKGGDDKMDITTLILLSNMGGNGGMPNMMSNPLMMASLLGGEDSSMSDMLPFMLMGNMQKPAEELTEVVKTYTEEEVQMLLNALIEKKVE